MGGLTIQATADLLGISKGTVRAYGDGNRKVPDYIEKLCELKEKQFVEGELTVAKASSPGGEVAQMLAVAYMQAMSRRNPVTAFTINRQAVGECMTEAVAAVVAMGVEFNAKGTDQQTAG